MISWQPSCRIQKQLNDINVNSEYCVRGVNFLFCLRFIKDNDVFFINYDLKSSDVKETSGMTSKSVNLHFNGFHNVYVFFQ